MKRLFIMLTALLTISIRISIRLVLSRLLKKFLYAAGIKLEMPVGGQPEIGRLLYLNLLETVGITNHAVAPQCPCCGAATIWLTVVGMLQQDADDLYTESLLQFLVTNAFTQIWVNFNDALSYTDVTRHATVLCHAMGAVDSEQGLLAEEPAFSNP